MEKVLMSLDIIITHRETFFAAAKAVKEIVENEMKCVSCFENHEALTQILEKCRPPLQTPTYQMGHEPDGQTPIIYQMNSFVNLGAENDGDPKKKHSPMKKTTKKPLKKIGKQQEKRGPKPRKN